MNGPADHAGDVLNCMLANGFTLVSFLSTILTSMCFSDKLQEIHFHILSPEENPDSGRTTIVKNWILTTTQAIYMEEIQTLMEKENGLHMNASNLHPAQLEAGKTSTLGLLFKSKAPALWGLFQQLLVVESKAQA